MKTEIDFLGNILNRIYVVYRKRPDAILAAIIEEIVARENELNRIAARLFELEDQKEFAVEAYEKHEYEGKTDAR